MDSRINLSLIAIIITYGVSIILFVRYSFCIISVIRDRIEVIDQQCHVALFLLCKKTGTMCFGDIALVMYSVIILILTSLAARGMGDEQFQQHITVKLQKVRQCLHLRLTPVRDPQLDIRSSPTLWFSVYFFSYAIQFQFIKYKEMFHRNYQSVC